MIPFLRQRVCKSWPKSSLLCVLSHVDMHMKVPYPVLPRSGCISVLAVLGPSAF